LQNIDDHIASLVRVLFVLGAVVSMGCGQSDSSPSSDTLSRAPDVSDTTPPDTTRSSSDVDDTGSLDSRDSLDARTDTGPDTSMPSRDTSDTAVDTDPTVAWKAPKDESVVNGETRLKVDASDDGEVAEVAFSVDDSPIATVDSQPYEHTWPSDDVAEGAHDLKVTVTDDAGQSVSKTIAITVDRTPPEISLTKPSSSTTIVNRLSVAATARDDSGVEQVEFRVDGSAVTEIVDMAPWKTELDVSSLASGNHVVEAVATDAAGLTGTSSTVDFTIDRDWTVEFLGTPKDDNIHDVAVGTSGAVYVGGTTRGDLGGKSNQGGIGDAFVARLDATGSIAWVRLVGSSSRDIATGLSVTDSAVFVTGTGGPAGSSSRSFVGKFDLAGNEKWLHKIDRGILLKAKDVVADARGHTFVTGNMTESGRTTRIAFLASFKPDGSPGFFNKLQPKSGDGRGRALTVDGKGSLYVTGWIQDKIGGQSYSGGFADAFLARYDTGGQRSWIRLVGSKGDEYGRGIAADGAGNVYVAGYGTDDLGGQTNASDKTDAFLLRFDDSGTRKWVRFVGVSKEARANGVAIGPSGNVFLGGEAKGNVGGHSTAGKFDMTSARFNPSGQRTWVDLIGSSSNDSGSGLTVTAAGRPLIVGRTFGNMGNETNAGSGDGVLWKPKP
jgi:hypothetical protein